MSNSDTSDPSAEAAHARYDEFVLAVRSGKEVHYLIKDSRFGCCLYEGESEPVILFWSDPSLSKLCRESRFKDYEPGHCSASDFLRRVLPYLDERGGWIGVNYDSDTTGISVRPRALITELEEIERDTLN